MQLQTLQETLGWTLIHIMWQGAAVAAALALVRRLSRRSTPNFRYVSACIALGVLAVLPVITFATIWNPASQAPVPAIAMLDEIPVDAAATVWMELVPSILPWLVTLWSLGVATLTCRSLVSWVRLHRSILRRATPLHLFWRRRVQTLQERIGLKRRVRILSSPDVVTPLVTGCLRPTILLPVSALTGLPVADLEALLLHELMHIRRWDLWVHRLQLILETLFFYHPAVWWISRVANTEREFCCDALVIRVTGDNIGYARALTRMESLRTPIPQGALAFTGGSLMSRIRKIVNPSTPQNDSHLPTAAWSLITVGLVVALVATTGVLAESPDGKTPLWMPASVSQWAPLFEDAAERHGVDPALLSIMTLIESRGNPEAVSSWGAVGLMQIMPRTAEGIARARGLKTYTQDQLRDPATNIDMAAWFLARQIATFGDGQMSEETVAKAVAAYNGGPARLRRHLADGAPLSEETVRYGKMVSALWKDRAEARSQAYEEAFGASR